MSVKNFNYKTRVALLTGLVILFSVGAGLCQGGTGRDSGTPVAKKTTSTKKSAPAKPVSASDRNTPTPDADPRPGETLEQALAHFGTVRETERGTTLVLTEWLWSDPRSSSLRSASLTGLARLSALLASNPNYQILVESHTDNEGSEGARDELTQDRARIISEHLLAAGVDRARIQANGYGAALPVAPNTSPANRAKNRRTEVILTRSQALKQTSTPNVGGATAEGRVSLGTVPSYADSNDGLTLDGVRDDSPAKKAGLKSGDKIVRIAGRDVKNINDFVLALDEMQAGKEYEIEILRGSERLVVRITPVLRK